MEVPQIPKNSKQVILQRMQEFTYYLTDYVEKEFIFFTMLLNDSAVPKKPNNDVITLASGAATQIPLIGKVVSKGLKEGETWLTNKMDRKDSKRLANLVYFHDNNKERVRKMLIEAAIKTFYCFEYQFRNLSCEGGPTRAMQKLAKDTAHRIVTYLVKNKQDMNVSKDDFCKGIISGSSLRNKYFIEEGKTVHSGSTEWTTLELYTKVGLFIEETNEFFKRKHCKCEKYAYRRIFPWEKAEEVRKKWPKDDPPIDLNLILKREDLEGLCQTFREYIMQQNVNEKAQLDRDKKHEEEMNDQQIKHSELLRVFLEQNSEVIDEVRMCYQELALKLIHHTELQEERYNKVDNKLTNIHSDVHETKERQVKIEKNTEEILEAVQVVRGEGSGVNSEQVKDGVQQCVDQLYMGFVNIVHSNDGLGNLVEQLGRKFNVKI